MIEAFHDGLTEYKSYLLSLQGREQDFSGSHLRHIISSFGPPLCTHLHDEIPTLLALAKYGDKVPLSKFWAKQRGGPGSLADIARVPFFFLNLDQEFEGGLWADWPPAPGWVKWGMRNLVSRVRRAGVWRFACCGKDGRPKELYAFKEELEEGKK
jgi:hypothetical protein